MRESENEESRERHKAFYGWKRYVRAKTEGSRVKERMSSFKYFFLCSGDKKKTFLCFKMSVLFLFVPVLKRSHSSTSS